MMKKITRRSFLTVCGAVAAAAALSACGGSASSTTASSAAASSTAASSVAASAAGDLSGNVATGGSTSMKNVIAALTEGFAEVQPGVTVSYDPTGSGAGITGATDKTLDIGLSSRALKDEEVADGLKSTTLALDGIADEMQALLDDIQQGLFNQAKSFRDAHTTTVHTMEELGEAVQTGFAKAMWCGDRACEDAIKEQFNASSRNMPFDQEGEACGDTCVCCGKKAKHVMYFAKAY